MNTRKKTDKEERNFSVKKRVWFSRWRNCHAHVFFTDRNGQFVRVVVTDSIDRPTKSKGLHGFEMRQENGNIHSLIKKAIKRLLHSGFQEMESA